MKILINVVNARNVGGGLQVVYNFVINTLNYPRPNIQWYYAVSKCLDENYFDDNFKENVKGRYFVFPNQPDFTHSYLQVQKDLRRLENKINPDVIYTILGPCYNFFKHKEVIRFVHPWVVTSNKYAWKTLPQIAKIRMKLHIILLKALLHRSKYIITQTNAVKNGLINKIHFKKEKIRVVNNVLPSIYSKLENTHIETHDSWINIIAVGAGYHKNLDIIPDILQELEHKHNIRNFRFHITLPKGALGLNKLEKKLEEYNYKERVVNHGNLKQKELAELYRKCDVCFLPSVLEVFSASTIEAMFFSLPTVATNLPFNIEVMGNSCLYYTPMNVIDATDKLVQIVTNKEAKIKLINQMQKQLKQFCSFEKYFNDTVDFLVEVALEKK